jgi:hypothetical protein
LLAQVTVIPGMGTLVNLPLSNLPLSNLPLQSIGTASTTTVGRAGATRPTSSRTVSESLVFGRGGGSNVVAFPMPIGFSDFGLRFLLARAPSLVGTGPRHLAVATRPQSHTVKPTAMPTPPPAASPAAPLAVGVHRGHHHHHH